MGLILRPVKTHGFREYTQEVAADPTDKIKASEVDGDLDTVYTLVNGNLESANLSPAAAIVGTQLSGAAGIVGAQLAAGANILGSQLAANAGIVAGQLAAAAIHRQIVFATPGPVNVNHAAPTGEITVATLPAITTAANALVVVGGTWNLAALRGALGVFDVRIRENGVEVLHVDPAIGGGGGDQVAIPCPLLLRTPAAGTYTYTFTAEDAVAGGVFNLGVAFGGIVFALELS